MPIGMPTMYFLLVELERGGSDANWAALQVDYYLAYWDEELPPSPIRTEILSEALVYLTRYLLVVELDWGGSDANWGALHGTY